MTNCTVVVVADMQPSTGSNVPPQVVAAQIVALSPAPNYILMPGDEANDGTSSEYTIWNNYYGSLFSSIYPVPGNHDWAANGDPVNPSTSLVAYDAEFGTQGDEGSTPPHFISLNTPNGWHILGFDSSEQWIGSVNNPSATYTAVEKDLAANSGKPVIAYWHNPRWSDGTNTADPGGTGDSTVTRDIWNLLYDYGCDIVLNGHCHSYQRFPKFGKTGTADPNGIREFVAGTGGSGLFNLTSTQRSTVNSYQASAYDQVNSQWFGYLTLTLTPTAYSWTFTSQNAVGSQNPGAILDSGGPVTANVFATSAGSGLLMASFP